MLLIVTVNGFTCFSSRLVQNHKIDVPPLHAHTYTCIQVPFMLSHEGF